MSYRLGIFPDFTPHLRRISLIEYARLLFVKAQVVVDHGPDGLTTTMMTFKVMNGVTYVMDTVQTKRAIKSLRTGEELSDAERARVVESRGGCICFIAPPCGRCTDPVTQDELDDLEIEAAA